MAVAVSACGEVGGAAAVGPAGGEAAGEGEGGAAAGACVLKQHSLSSECSGASGAPPAASKLCS